MRLGIVVPCFNEELVLPETANRLAGILDRLTRARIISGDSAVYFVDDGSSDSTWPLIQRLANDNALIHGIKLSRNRGHQNALLAGLLHAEGDVIISVDADLQDDLEAIPKMLEAARKGNDVVYGVRSSRTTDTFFKRQTAQWYYRLLHMFGVDAVYDHADYRLLSRRAIDALRQFGEVNLFLRGIVPQLGFPSTTVEYERHERFAGESKYPLRKMLGLAANGITSFSAVPLRLIALVGVLVFLTSFAMIGWVLYVRVFTVQAVPGWASSVIPIYFLGGIQLLSVGVLGEYLARLYMEVKARPRYVIEEIV